MKLGNLLSGLFGRRPAEPERVELAPVEPETETVDPYVLRYFGGPVRAAAVAELPASPSLTLEQAREAWSRDAAAAHRAEDDEELRARTASLRERLAHARTADEALFARLESLAARRGLFHEVAAAQAALGSALKLAVRKESSEQVLDERAATLRAALERFGATTLPESSSAFALLGAAADHMQSFADEYTGVLAEVARVAEEYEGRQGLPPLRYADLG